MSHNPQLIYTVYIYLYINLCFHSIGDYIVISLLPWYKHFRRKYYSFMVKGICNLVGVQTTASIYMNINDQTKKHQKMRSWATRN
jgi:hypothetical protein